MPYTKQTWVNDSSPLNATRMNYIEQGIFDAMAAAEGAGSMTEPSPQVTNGPVYWNGSTWVSAKLTNAQIDAAAAIAYSKLALTGSIANADISSAAAIAYSKLALSGSIVNADISGSAAIAGGKVNFNYGTSLPGSPVDGDIAVLVDSTTNPTYQWLFRYHSGSSNTDKWELVGGAPAVVFVETSEGTTSVSYTNLSTTGPQFTIPRAGVYHVEWGGTLTNGSSGSNGFMALQIDTGKLAAADTIALIGNGQGSTTGSRVYQTARLAASDVLIAKYKSSSGSFTQTFAQRYMRVTPVRVS